MSLLPLDFFSKELNKNQSLLLETKQKIRNTSILRLIIFLVAAIAVYVSTTISSLALIISIVTGLAAFIFLVRKHLHLYKQKQWYESLVKVNKYEISIFNMENNAEFSGNEFTDDDHAFSSDLDIFGGKSVFGIINRSSTLNGKKELARQLAFPNTDEELIKRRQKSIAELKSKNQWRQEFQAMGYLNPEKAEDVEGLKKWANTKEKTFNNTFYRSMLIANPLLGFGIVLLISLGILNVSALAFFLIIPFLLVGGKLSIINKQHSLMSKKTDLLIKYSKLFKLIEKEEFASELISEIKESLSLGGHSAFSEISKLSKIMSAFDYRLNMIMGFLLNIFFLWDIRQLIKLEKWKKKNAESLVLWFEHLSTIDELNSFAGFNFSFQLSTIPSFSSNFKIDVKNAMHPFIKKENNVGNPISVKGWKQFKVITGANMAGKSTYLRTVGVNLVLAMTGSAVMADKFIFKPIQIISGIKTSDSLQDGESYFFAELKRLKAIIDKLERGDKLFIILDEILRGTNSADKQKGSLGLIKQLLRLNASGIIATHDLALGRLIENFPENITNNRFEVEIANNELVFDYKIKEGVSQNLNATFLMKKMGITIE
jgi:DNA mismatch repair ATPase MutS